MLRLLTVESDSSRAKEQASTVARLGATDEEQHQARAEVLRAVVADESSWRGAAELTEFGATAEDKQAVRRGLMAELTADTGQLPAITGQLVMARQVRALADLGPTAEEKLAARQGLMAALTADTSRFVQAEVIEALVTLEPTAEEKRQAREVLVRKLSAQRSEHDVTELTGGPLLMLDPVAGDLRSAQAWAAPPSRKLLVAVRRNTALPDWLALLPSLQPDAREESFEQRRQLNREREAFQEAVDWGTRPGSWKARSASESCSKSRETRKKPAPHSGVQGS